MIKNSKKIISLLAMAVSVSMVSSQAVFASEGNKNEEIKNENYVGENLKIDVMTNCVTKSIESSKKVGIDKNNIKWRYDVCSDGTIDIALGDVSAVYDFSGEISIPSEINGYTVSKIGKNAFNGNYKITSVKIPSNVKTIGAGAFFGCTNLRNVEIENGLTTIETGAFGKCTNLSDIKIPSNVSEISSSVFAETPWLAQQKNSNKLVIVNDIIIDGTGSSGDLTIPSNIKAIVPHSFKDTKDLTSVVITPSVKSIGEFAFDGCINLKKVTLI